MLPDLCRGRAGWFQRHSGQVAALLVMAFMLLKGCNSMMLSKPEAAEALKS